uniref:Uncharacterized protein n=1 Tax=Phasianus colchicus TaxID=9054 RepID=A0A669QHB1_PHACC
DPTEGRAMDRMKKIKRQLSMTLRGGRGPEKGLGETRDGPNSDGGESGPLRGGGTGPLSGSLSGPLRGW